MIKLGPSMMGFAVMLFFAGYNGVSRGEQRQAAIQNPFDWSERSVANREIETGRFMQMGAGALAVAGAILFGLGLIHRQGQTQALKHRLAVSYTFVAAVPSDGAAPDPGLLTEDQAADALRTRYPTLATTATEKLRKEFADKRRLEPTKIWYVKDFEVREVPPPA